MEDIPPVAEQYPKQSPRSVPEPESKRLPTPDTELVRRAQQGVGTAMDELVNRHAPELFALAMSLIGNRPDAEDVVQETLVGAVKGLASFEGRASVKTWLTKILVRQIARHRRTKRPESLDGKTVGQTSSASVDAKDNLAARDAPGPAMQVERRIDVQTMLQTLSMEHREVLVLRELQGLSYDEIAEALEVPRGTVESRLHRAREQLRQRFANYV